ATAACSRARGSPEVCTLALPDALPIWRKGIPRRLGRRTRRVAPSRSPLMPVPPASYFPSRSGAPAVEPSFPRGQPGLHLAHQIRSEEHTSELQSRENLVCRLPLDKKHH